MEYDGLSLGGADDVEGGASFEPVDLLGVVAVVHGDGVGGAIAVIEYKAEGNTGGEGGKTDHVDEVVFLDEVVVLFVGEGQAEHALLFEVGLVDPGEGLDEDNPYAEVAGLHGCVLTG